MTVREQKELLRIVRRLAASKPWITVDQSGEEGPMCWDYEQCELCGADDFVGTSIEKLAAHKRWCPWRKAKEFVNREARGRKKSHGAK